MAKYINRIKVVLAEQHKTNLWLARELGKDPATGKTGADWDSAPEQTGTLLMLQS